MVTLDAGIDCLPVKDRHHHHGAGDWCEVPALEIRENLIAIARQGGPESRRSWRKYMNPRSVDDEAEGVAFNCRNHVVDSHGQRCVEMQECLGAERFDVIEAGDEIRLPGPCEPE